jgi:hypothetical protein
MPAAIRVDKRAGKADAVAIGIRRQVHAPGSATHTSENVEQRCLPWEKLTPE